MDDTYQDVGILAQAAVDVRFHDAAYCGAWIEAFCSHDLNAEDSMHGSVEYTGSRMCFWTCCGAVGSYDVALFTSDPKAATTSNQCRDRRAAAMRRIHTYLEDYHNVSPLPLLAANLSRAPS